MVVGRVVLAAAAALLAGCAAVSAPSSTPASLGQRPSLTPDPTPTLPPGVAQVLDIGEPVYDITSAGDTVWLEGDFTLHQLDGATGEILQSMPGYAPSVVDGTLWYLRDEELVSADPTSGQERAVYHPPMLGQRTVHDGVLWVANEQTGTLASIDLERNEVLSEVALPDGEPKAVEHWEDAVWVVIDGSDVVVRADPRTGEITDSIDAGRRPHSVAVGFGSLWVIEHGGAEVLRLQPNGDVAAAIAGPGINVAIAAVSDSVWAAAYDSIMQVDPATNKVIREIEIGHSDWYAIAASQDSLWLTSGERRAVFQIPCPDGC